MTKYLNRKIAYRIQAIDFKRVETVKQNLFKHLIELFNISKEKDFTEEDFLIEAINDLIYNLNHGIIYNQDTNLREVNFFYNDDNSDSEYNDDNSDSDDKLDKILNNFLELIGQQDKDQDLYNMVTSPLLSEFDLFQMDEQYRYNQIENLYLKFLNTDEYKLTIYKNDSQRQIQATSYSLEEMQKSAIKEMNEQDEIQDQNSHATQLNELTNLQKQNNNLSKHNNFDDNKDVSTECNSKGPVPINQIDNSGNIFVKDAPTEIINIGEEILIIIY